MRLVADRYLKMATNLEDDYGCNTTKDTFMLRYILTVTASSVAEVVTYPLDITRTRLQIQGEKISRSVLQNVNRTSHRGMLQTMLGIVKEEGLLNLWGGVNAAVLRHSIYSSRMPFYEFMRERVFLRDEDGAYPLWKAVPTGMLSGAMGQFLASPTDLVKTRLQMEGRRLLDGYKPRYKGTWNAFYSILKSEGITGLWRGWYPNCQRAAVACLGDLTSYDVAKQTVLQHTRLKDNILTHAIASTCAGLVSSIFCTPADVIKSRMLNQPYLNGRGVHYKSTLDCLLQTLRSEGFWSMYKGFWPTWGRLAPWSVTFWLVYEQLRIACGMKTF